MKKIICNILVIVCSLSLFMLVSDCTCVNNALGAEFEFPEDLLSQDVVWEKCKLFEEKMMSRMAECADITVPLYWDNPDAENMTIRVKRLKALSKATKQLWLLEGGPGGDGTAYLAPFMKTIAQLDWGIDLYTLDHRGGGYSNRLTCPQQEDNDSDEGREISENEWDACIDYLKDTYKLDAITVTEAAKDVGFLVELLKEENKEIFVYGVSYGTYWAHRYAQIFPGHADGMILDSLTTPVYHGLDQYDIDANDVLKDFFDICKDDEFCRSKMGDDPLEKATNTFEKFNNGYCNEVSKSGFTPEILQGLASGLLDLWHLRIVLPALYYRLDRCNEEDVNAFKHMWNILSPRFSTQSVGSEHPNIPRHYTPNLMDHILLSEMMPDNPISPEEWEEKDKELLATAHYSHRCVKLLEKWPTYDTDDYYREWASQLKTTIDQARIAKENLNGPNQYFVEVPNAIHKVCWKQASPVKSIFAPDCGMQIMLDYIKDPLSEPDTSCLDDLVPINFRGNPLLALLLFGTLDIWENGINAGLD
jgi:pimeloyl-ACP methyl ester carboxylesterase